MDIKRPGTPYAHLTVEEAKLHDAMPARPCLSHKEMRLRRRQQRSDAHGPKLAHTSIERGWTHFLPLAEAPPPPSIWQRCLRALGL
jgi:hypothetical protein